jgi:hypothetical protein
LKFEGVYPFKGTSTVMPLLLPGVRETPPSTGYCFVLLAR